MKQYFDKRVQLRLTQAKRALFSAGLNCLTARIDRLGPEVTLHRIHLHD